MSSPPITLVDSATIDLAEDVMAMARIRHLPIVDDRRRLVGLISYRDVGRGGPCARADVPTSRLNRSQPVSELMETEFHSISADAPALDAARLMREHRCSCVPVCDEDTVIGVITAADFVDLAIHLLERKTVGAKSRRQLPLA